MQADVTKQAKKVAADLAENAEPYTEELAQGLEMRAKDAASQVEPAADRVSEAAMRGAHRVHERAEPMANEAADRLEDGGRSAAHGITSGADKVCIYRLLSCPKDVAAFLRALCYHHCPHVWPGSHRYSSAFLQKSIDLRAGIRTCAAGGTEGCRAC